VSESSSREEKQVARTSDKLVNLESLFRRRNSSEKMSTSRSKNDKEREKIVQDRLQILLTRMLQDDDNKYCVDCDSKG